MVFFDWELVYTCNYRCSYCFYTSSGWENQYPMNVFPGLERLTAIWERMHAIYGPCHIQIAGGECSTYPNFYDFIKMMLSRHTVTMVTNLSFDVEKFVSMVDLKRMFIGASYHPQFSEFEKFLSKCVYLKEKGIPNLFVNFVAYPDQLDGMPEYKRRVNEAGFEFYVDPFTGIYKKETPYPAGYTEQQKEIINRSFANDRADSRLSAARFSWGGSPNESGAGKLLNKIDADRKAKGEAPIASAPVQWRSSPWEKSSQPVEWDAVAVGKALRASTEVAGVASETSACFTAESPRKPVLCRQGQKYAKVRANGDAFRCCAQLRDDRPSPLFKETVYLGNLFLDDNFKLLEEPAMCDYEPCPCDRCMIVGEESRWESRWKAPAVS